MTDDFDQRVEETLALMIEYCREEGIPMFGHDRRVTEGCAAKILGYAKDTLRNMRAAGTAPTWFNIQRVSYRLIDCARWQEARRQTEDVA